MLCIILSSFSLKDLTEFLAHGSSFAQMRRSSTRVFYVEVTNVDLKEDSICERSSD